MVKIKICGITNPDDARAAIEAGADMLGFNFYRPSPRFLEPQSARAIIENLRAEIGAFARKVTTAGVFVNEPSAEDVIRTAEAAGVDAIQLHGDESLSFCKALKLIAPDHLVIKVHRVAQGFEPQEAAAYEVDAIMLDAFDKNLYGGTGRVIDWSIAHRVSELVPRLFLSGGLSPSNVAEAIATVRPYGVDACSALESSPGRKDVEQIHIVP